MTVKQFLKSKAFRAILVLLCIALVSGALLAILNDVLYISDTERTQRAIKKVYGSNMNFVDMNDNLGEDATNQYGTITSLYLLSDGNYLIKSVGANGYKGGSVTLWVVAEFVDGNFVGLKKIVLEGNDKQTLMSQFGNSFFEVYAENNQYVLEGGYFVSRGSDEQIQNISAGATFTSNAVNNAVNCALTYIRTVILEADNG